MKTWFMLNIGYSWGVNLITNCYPFDTLEGAKAEIERLLPGTVWEDQGTYLIVDLHQYEAPASFINEQGHCHSVFHIYIEWDAANRTLPYHLATKDECRETE